jgi:hypothetical protein
MNHAKLLSEAFKALEQYERGGIGMKAGRELDALIAVHIMGYEKTYHDCGLMGTRLIEQAGKTYAIPEMIPEYSTNIADAWLVVEKMIELGWQYEVQGWGKQHGHHSTFITWVPHNGGMKQIIHHEEAETAPLAICLAALKACGVSIDGI